MITTIEVQDCWRKIGIWGDRSCAELVTYYHCYNCPVYSAVGRSLLEREAPLDYVSEWTDVLANETSIRSELAAVSETTSVTIFRLGKEWVALPSHLFQEITQVQNIHDIPHRSNDVLLGLVNIRGEIQLCVSLFMLLGIERESDDKIVPPGHAIYPRMAVIEKEKNRWVFPLDEVYGIHRLHRHELQEVPSTVSKRSETFTRQLLFWQGKKVALLDEELLFYALARRVL